MSPHTVSNFVTDLVEMARAVEELPKVQHELEINQGRIATLEESLMSRELRIIELKSEIETHLSTIRTLEVSRDDAEMRFLELEETSNMVRRVLNDISSSAQNQARQITTVLEPKKPETVLTPTDYNAKWAALEQGASSEASIQPSVIGPSNVDNPLTGTSPGAEPGLSMSENGQAREQASEPGTQGESASHPTASTQEVATVHGVGSEASASILPSDPIPGPYSGKLYINIPGWVSREDWLAGGGTYEDYVWREGDDNRYRA